MAIKNFKSKGVLTTNPFPKILIPLNEISWEVSRDLSTIKLNSCEFLKNGKYNSEKYHLGIYVFDSSNDFLFDTPLNEIINFPIDFNIKRFDYEELTGSANFKVIIIDTYLNKRIVAETAEIKLVPKEKLENILETRAKNLGKRIAVLDITSNGPILSINKNLITSKGKLSLKNIENIVQTDPVFLCGFFPKILNEIFSIAFLEKPNHSWAKDWVGYAEQLVPGIFRDFKRKNYENILELNEDTLFQNALDDLSDEWIKQNKLDTRLLEKFKIEQ